jgi:hypothetical protein
MSQPEENGAAAPEASAAAADVITYDMSQLMLKDE